MRRVISLITLVSAAGLVSVLGCYRGANSGKAGTGSHQQTTVTSETVRSDTQQPGPSHVVPNDRGAGQGPAGSGLGGSGDGRGEGYPPAGAETWGTSTRASDFDNTGAASSPYGSGAMGGDGGKIEMGGADGGKKIAPEMGGDSGK